MHSQTKLELLECLYTNVEKLRPVQSYEDAEVYENALLEAYEKWNSSFQKEQQRPLTYLEFACDVTDSVGWNWLFRSPLVIPSIE